MGRAVTTAAPVDEQVCYVEDDLSAGSAMVAYVGNPTAMEGP